MKNRRFGCKGVTLIELLVVMLIAVLLPTLGVPAYSAMLDSVRLGTATQTFFHHLVLTRSEAIKRNARVVLCKSDTGTNCSLIGGWEQGWIVFYDDNNNAMVDEGEVILQREQTLPPSIRVVGNSHVQSYVSYTPMGRTSLTGGAIQAGTFTICGRSPTPTQARQIVISSSGRARTQRVTVDQC
jgi:type IV fimbrial biogenesis protein FimT